MFDQKHIPRFVHVLHTASGPIITSLSDAVLFLRKLAKYSSLDLVFIDIDESHGLGESRSDEHSYYSYNMGQGHSPASSSSVYPSHHRAPGSLRATM